MALSNSLSYISEKTVTEAQNDDYYKINEFSVNLGLDNTSALHQLETSSLCN